MKPFSSDRRDSKLPLAEVEERRAEFRRANRRVRVPVNYCQVADSGIATPLAVSLLAQKNGALLAQGFLFDINDGGAGFISPDILSTGEKGLLTLHYEGDETPVHSGEVEVRSARDPQTLEANEIPQQFRGKTLMIYGLQMSEETSRGFMRYTLESLALAQIHD